MQGGKGICIWDWLGAAVAYWGGKKPFCTMLLGQAWAGLRAVQQLRGVSCSPSATACQKKEGLLKFLGCCGFLPVVVAFWDTAALSHAAWTFQGMETLHHAYEASWG